MRCAKVRYPTEGAAWTALEQIDADPGQVMTESTSPVVRIGRDLQPGDLTMRRARCMRCDWEGIVRRIVGSRIIPTCKRCGYYTEAIR